MKNRGFTLIELLIVVALIGALSVVTALGMSGMTDRQRKKDKEAFESYLEKAACTHVEINNIYLSSDPIFVRISELLKEGLVRKTVTNPCYRGDSEEKKTILDYKDNTVEVYLVDNEKKCEFTIPDNNLCN